MDRDTIFISHASPDDNVFVGWLSERLSASGHRVWADLHALKGGSPFWSEIEDVLRNRAAKVVFVASRRSVEPSRDAIRNELSLAAAMGRQLGDARFIVPVRMDDTPFADLPIQLHQLNMLDFSGDREAALAALLGSLPETAGSAVAPKPARLTQAGNLRRYLVDCVAREDESAAVAKLVGAQRLVSIVGPGGVGKTTLALAVANEVASAFRDGIWVIDLAALGNDDAAIESAVIETLGIGFRQGATELETIAAELRDKSVLLVLDNCDHLAVPAGAMVRRLLVEAPGLKALTTTQVPLGIAGEQIFKLVPFGAEQAERFVEHCYAAQGEDLAPAERPTVTRLCRDLDGLALALKLAASEAATVGFEAVEQQLAQQFDLGSGDDGRHGSLRASMEWSFGLLPEEARRVFRQFGVFQGSFGLAGATAVAGDAARAALAELVRRSMVMRDATDRTRYRLLEPMRLFALQLLTAAGEETAARSRHAAHMREVFWNGLQTWETTPDDEWVAALRPDSANLRSALEWTGARGDWPLFAALTAASHRYWFQMFLPREELDRCETALRVAAHIDAETRAVLTVAASEYAGLMLSVTLPGLLDLDWAITQLGSERLIETRVQGLLLKGVGLEWSDRTEAARPVFREADALAAPLPDSKLKARTLVTFGMNLWAAGDKDVGLAKIEAGLAMHEAFGNYTGYATSAIYAAEAMFGDGDVDAAIAITERTLPTFREHVAGTTRVLQLHNLTAYLLSAGRADAARTLLAEAATMAADAEHQTRLCLMQSLAEIAALDGRTTDAALLVGHVDRGFSGYDGGRHFTEQKQLARILASLGERGMSDADVARLREQGAGMSAFEAERLSRLGRRPPAR